MIARKQMIMCLILFTIGMLFFTASITIIAVDGNKPIMGVGFWITIATLILGSGIICMAFHTTIFLLLFGQTNSVVTQEYEQAGYTYSVPYTT